jgi:hypothetical protein
MGMRTLLDLQVWCPWSGITVGGEKIAPHKITVVVCSNQTLYSYCSTCQVRAFTANWNLVSKVMKNSIAVKVTEKPTFRIRKRGKANESENKTP